MNIVHYSYFAYTVYC